MKAFDWLKQVGTVPPCFKYIYILYYSSNSIVAWSNRAFKQTNAMKIFQEKTIYMKHSDGQKLCVVINNDSGKKRRDIIKWRFHRDSECGNDAHNIMKTMAMKGIDIYNDGWHIIAIRVRMIRRTHSQPTLTTEVSFIESKLNSCLKIAFVQIISSYAALYTTANVIHVTPLTIISNIHRLQRIIFKTLHRLWNNIHRHWSCKFRLPCYQ